jgi:hypothetical protein
MPNRPEPLRRHLRVVRAATPPDLRALAQLAHKNPETVMLHFVQPAGRRADDQRAQADTGGRNRPAGFVANGPGRRATIRLSSRTFFESPNERRTRTTDSISPHPPTFDRVQEQHRRATRPGSRATYSRPFNGYDSSFEPPKPSAPRNACSAGVVSRPSARFRWGNRPNL